MTKSSRKIRGLSSNGRALALHARGSGIDARSLHIFCFCPINQSVVLFLPRIEVSEDACFPKQRSCLASHVGSNTEVGVVGMCYLILIRRCWNHPLFGPDLDSRSFLVSRLLLSYSTLPFRYIYVLLLFMFPADAF